MIQVFPTNFPPANTPLVNSQGAMTIPGMSFFRALFNRTGQENGLVNQVNLDPDIDLVADWNLVNATTIGGTVNLPHLTGGQAILIQNTAPAAPLTINAPLGATIDAVATYSLAAGKMQIFWFFSETQIFSTQLG